MKWGLISLVPTLGPMFGDACAQGNGDGDGAELTIAGTIVSVNAGANSFVADAFALGGDREPESGDVDVEGHLATANSSPTPVRITVTTSSDTEFWVNGATGTISCLAAGDRFRALFDRTGGSDITTLVANNPALTVTADAAPRMYAFVGTVTALATPSSGSGGTVSVDVTNAIPPELASSAWNPVTFTVGADTLILGGSGSGGLSVASLSGISVGDVVAGGLIVAPGDSLSRVEGAPLRLLLDFPASGSSQVGRNA